ncbi:MAG: YggU family protein [Epsilonproteobacteria bacterium]|nr:YggU family protein [Campylobacterota bacterium]
MFYKIDDSGEYIYLKIKAQPSSSKSEISSLYGDDAIKIRLAAPAVDGAANKELIKFLSKFFKVPKSKIEIIKGKSSKIKEVKILYNEKVANFIKDLDGKSL